MVLLENMVILLTLMILGWYLAKIQVLNDQVCEKLSWLIVNVANPALIISGALDLEEAMEIRDLFNTFVISCIMFAALLVLAEILPRILRVSTNEQGIFKVLLAFSNVGFMGFPLISAVYGSQALLYGSVFLIPFNVLIYTYGVIVISRGKKRKLPLKNILNIGVVACVVLIICTVFHIHIPEMAGTFVQMLSDLTAPLSMMVIGASMLGISFQALFKNYRLVVFSLIKMVVIPMAGGRLLQLLVQDHMPRDVCLILLSTPAASMDAMLARQYGGDYELAARGVLISTIISVVTMPLVFAIYGG